MMILPLACIMLLPHVMNDPEAKKVTSKDSFWALTHEMGVSIRIYFQDMEQLQNLTKYDMPEVSEMITSFFSGSNEKQNCRPSKQSKKSKSSWSELFCLNFRYSLPPRTCIWSNDLWTCILRRYFSIFCYIFSISIAYNSNFL